MTEFCVFIILNIILLNETLVCNQKKNETLVPLSKKIETIVPWNSY